MAIEQYEELAYDLLDRVLGIKQAFISDETSLDDFDFEIVDGEVKRDREICLKKIEEIYGVDVSDVEGLNLALICQRIEILGNRQ